MQKVTPSNEAYKNRKDEGPPTEISDEPRAFNETLWKKIFLWSGAPCQRFWYFTSKIESLNLKKKVLFSFIITLIKSICGQITAEIRKKQNLHSDFSRIGCKMSRPPTPIFIDWKFFYRNFVKKTNFEAGDPQNRRFWAFFQKWMFEMPPTRK